MRVILAPRRASVIALRNPEALVVDYETRCVRRGAERVNFYGNAPTKRFQFCAALCCAAGSEISRYDLIEMLWGDAEDGGPLCAYNIISRMLYDARPFLRWAGLTVQSTYFFGMIEVRPNGAPQAQGSFRRDHGNRHPRRVAA